MGDVAMIGVIGVGVRVTVRMGHVPVIGMVGVGVRVRISMRVCMVTVRRITMGVRVVSINRTHITMRVIMCAILVRGVRVCGVPVVTVIGV